VARSAVDHHLNPPPGLVRRLAPYLIPKPWTGRLWLDLTYLLACAAVSQALLSDGPLAGLNLDLLTPWLVTGFILQPLPAAILLGLVGGLVLETHSTAPAGLYVCIYLVAAVVIGLVKNTLSWRHSVPWLVTMLSTAAWFVLFEGFVASVLKGPEILTPMYLLQQLTRIMSVAGIGMICLTWWRSLEVIEGDAATERPEP
jgi:hypothetical protein